MRNLQRYLLIVCALICPTLTWAQGGVPASPIYFSGPTGRPLAGATITFCTSSGTGFPCSPLASIFTNAGLSIASPNPVTTDGNGNIPVIFASPGVYILSVTGSGITPTLVTATVAGTGGGNVTTSGPNAFTNTNTMGRLNAMRFVDGTQFATAQAAIADCTTTIDCWVLVPPGTQPVPNNINRSHLHLVGYTQGVPATTITAATNLVWGTPPADNKVIFTSATGTTFSGLWDTTIEGITFDCLGNNVNCVVLQNGAFENHFGTPASKIVIQNTGTGAALTLNGGSVAGQSVVGNEFDISIFNAGKGVVLTATAPGVSANNVFHFVHTQNISIRAWEFVQNADSNRIEWAFISGLGNAAQGIAFNTGTPGTDVDADGNVFTHCLCADVQNPGAYTATLVTVNKSVGNAILDWEIGPGITSGGGSELSNPSRYPFNYQITTDFNTTVNDGAISAAGNIAGKRYGTTGTPLTTGAFSFNAGWGTSPSFTSVRGTDSALSLILASGSGSPAANPSLVLTFADGSWGTVPICSVTTLSSTAPNWGISGVSTASALTIVFIGTPAASTTYQINVACSQSPN